MDNRNYDGILWYQHSDGYWYNKKYGYQHVYVWERAHQATVDSDDVVHHINRDKTDNRIENLQLMTGRDHISLHSTGNQIWRGKHHSEESKQKQSIAKIGKSLSVEHCKAIGLGSSKMQRSLGIRESNKSGFKGVGYYKKYDKWVARIWAENRRHCLGYFETAIEAARAYDIAARKYFGENCFQNLNKDKQEEQNEEIRIACDEKYNPSLARV